MEYLFEFILELVLEGSIEASKSKKVPKPIRYMLITLIVLFFIAVIGIIFVAGFLSLKKSLIVGIFLILIGLIMLIGSYIKFKSTYLNMKGKNNNE